MNGEGSGLRRIEALLPVIWGLGGLLLTVGSFFVINWE